MAQDSDPARNVSNAGLDPERHVKYWKRCFRSLLPHQYTSNDSIRLTLGFFTLAALDILDSPRSHGPEETKSEPIIPPKERRKIREFILSLQHRNGGFVGSPNHSFPSHCADGWDQTAQKPVPADRPSANIAATAFALLTLALASSSPDSEVPRKSAFVGIHRRKTLRWLQSLQREDGSFGEVINDDGKVMGGRDMRYCYFASIIRWCLGGGQEGVKDADFDVEKLVSHIRNGQTFDGGVAESSMHESHAGYAYCAVAALTLLDRPSPLSSTSKEQNYLQQGIPNQKALVHWLASRQFVYVDNPDDDDPEVTNFAELTLDGVPKDLEQVLTGFNGRQNKNADTCYTWWTAGALSLLGQTGLIASVPARNFLLLKTQHLIGGFSKYPGGRPDIYHAYLGLAALGTVAPPTVGMSGDEDDKDSVAFDTGLCVSNRVTRTIEQALVGLVESEKGYRLWATSQEEEDNGDET